jgi:hypothetical protein
MYDEFRLNADTFKGTISDTQRKVVKNTYTKRLATQLSESLVPKIFSATKDHLHGLFSGNDFNFFDANGNFVGEHLKVIEEINVKIKTQFVDGKTLEADLSVAPWGYSFGTLASTLAALLRAGRLNSTVILTFHMNKNRFTKPSPTPRNSNPLHSNLLRQR